MVKSFAAFQRQAFAFLILAGASTRVVVADATFVPDGKECGTYQLRSLSFGMQKKVCYDSADFGDKNLYIRLEGQEELLKPENFYVMKCIDETAVCDEGDPCVSFKSYHHKDLFLTDPFDSDFAVLKKESELKSAKEASFCQMAGYMGDEYSHKFRSVIDPTKFLKYSTDRLELTDETSDTSAISWELQKDGCDEKTGDKVDTDHDFTLFKKQAICPYDSHVGVEEASSAAKCNHYCNENASGKAYYFAYSSEEAPGCICYPLSCKDKTIEAKDYKKDDPTKYDEYIKWDLYECGADDEEGGDDEGVKKEKDITVDVISGIDGDEKVVTEKDKVVVKKAEGVIKVDGVKGTDDCKPDTFPTGLAFGSYSDNPQCVSGGKDPPFGFDYGWKMDGCNDVRGAPLSVADPGGEIKGSCGVAGRVTVDITCNADKSATITWYGLNETYDKIAIKIKGGPGGNIYDGSGTTSGTYFPGKTGGGKGYADISHIEICLQCSDCGGTSPTGDTPTVSPYTTETPTGISASPVAVTEGPTAPSPLTHSPTEYMPPTASPSVEPPTPVEKPPPEHTSGSFGDPHVKTWGGDMFDFHGACDLVLVDSPRFAKGKGLTVHIRTKIVTWWSYISTAVIKIGDETFELQGGKNVARYWINGVEGTNPLTKSSSLESKISGHPIFFTHMGKKQKTFRLRNLPQGVAISFETFNDFVRVNIRADGKWHFMNALGLMGAFPDGKKVGRDGKTVFEDTNAFGQEWQVLPHEPKLFHDVEGVQFPEKCLMPSSLERKTRRLGETLLTEEDAKAACSHVADEYLQACVSDVLATNSKEISEAY